MSVGFRSVSGLSESGLVEIAANIWALEAAEPVYYRPPIQPRYPYTHRGVVIRLEDSSLFVHSPIRLTAEIRAAVDELGTVKHIVAPNHLHHLHIGDWSTAYPEAKLYGAPQLAAKRKDLTFAKILSTDVPEPEWAGQIDQCLFGTGSGWLDEMVFFHRASRTVIFTDMVMDFDPAVFSPLTRRTTRWNQMYRHTPRGIQFIHNFDRVVLRQSLATVQSWQPEHLTIAHSPWVCVDGKESVADLLNDAFDWLKPRSAITEAVLGAARLSTLFFLIVPAHLLLVLIADIGYGKLLNGDRSAKE